MEEIIKKIFHSFDKSQSGKIDLNDLKEVSKQLGREMDQSELEECLKDIDITKDDQIGYKAFRKWWLSGRQGQSRSMRRLLAFKLKTMKLFGTISGTLKDVITQAGTDNEISVNSLSLNINKVLHAGTTVMAKLLFLSPELIAEHYRIKTLHKFENLEERPIVLGSIIFSIKENKVEEVM